MRQNSLVALFLFIICFSSCKDESKTGVVNKSEKTINSNDANINSIIDSTLNTTSIDSSNPIVDVGVILEETIDSTNTEKNTRSNYSDKIVTPSKEEKNVSITTSASKSNAVKVVSSSNLKLDNIVFDDLILTYDTITAGDKIKRKYYFTNKNDYPIEVVSTYPDCGCTAPSFPFLPIEKGERGFIGVDYNSVGKQGKQISNIHIKFKGIKEEKIIKLIGFVKEK